LCIASWFVLRKLAMQDNEIYFKTALGSEELKSRARRLPSRVRTMLIMVDGVQTVAQLNAAAATLGAPEGCMALLFEYGLIAVDRRSVPRPGTAAAAPSAAQVDVQLPMDQQKDDRPTVQPQLTDAARYLAAQKLMNDSAVDTLGLRAFFFTLKLERAFNCDDLRAVLPDFSKALSKGKDPAAAAMIEARVRVLLSANVSTLN
jgi:hypothetical protein